MDFGLGQGLGGGGGFVGHHTGPRGQPLYNEAGRRVFISPNATDIYLIGTASPNQKHEGSVHYSYSTQDIDTNSDTYAHQTMQGRFVDSRDEHNPLRSVGKVLMTYRTNSDNMGCVAHLDSKTPAGRSAIRRVVEGNGIGLSLGNGSKEGIALRLTDIPKTETRRFVEISVTETPCYDMQTQVHAFSDQPGPIFEQLAGWSLPTPENKNNPNAVKRLPQQFQNLPKILADQFYGEAKRFYVPPGSSPLLKVAQFFTHIGNQQKLGSVPGDLSPFFAVDQKAQELLTSGKNMDIFKPERLVNTRKGENLPDVFSFTPATGFEYLVVKDPPGSDNEKSSVTNKYPDDFPDKLLEVIYNPGYIEGIIKNLLEEVHTTASSSSSETSNMSAPPPQIPGAPSNGGQQNTFNPTESLLDPIGLTGALNTKITLGIPPQFINNGGGGGHTPNSGAASNQGAPPQQPPVQPSQTGSQQPPATTTPPVVPNQPPANPNQAAPPTQPLPIPQKTEDLPGGNVIPANADPEAVKLAREKAASLPPNKTHEEFIELAKKMTPEQLMMSMGIGSKLLEDGVKDPNQFASIVSLSKTERDELAAYRKQQEEIKKEELAKAAEVKRKASNQPIIEAVEALTARFRDPKTGKFIAKYQGVEEHVKLLDEIKTANETPGKVLDVGILAKINEVTTTAGKSMTDNKHQENQQRAMDAARMHIDNFANTFGALLGKSAGSGQYSPQPQQPTPQQPPAPNSNYTSPSQPPAPTPQQFNSPNNQTQEQPPMNQGYYSNGSSPQSQGSQGRAMDYGTYGVEDPNEVITIASKYIPDRSNQGGSGGDGGGSFNDFYEEDRNSFVRWVFALQQSEVPPQTLASTFQVNPKITMTWSDPENEGRTYKETFPLFN